MISSGCSRSSASAAPSDAARRTAPGGWNRPRCASHGGGCRRRTPIMCFVGNPGCIQIHTGPIYTLKVMGPWFNILDPTFNLHLREDAIHQGWVVRKPTRDGIVTSLELFDRMVAASSSSSASASPASRSCRRGRA